jgi:oligosaccharide repeat unit polymerase
MTLYIIVFITLTCVCIYYIFYKKEPFYSPVRLYSLLFFITNIPYLLLLYFDTSYIMISIKNVMTDDVYYHYAIVYMIICISTFPLIRYTVSKTLKVKQIGNRFTLRANLTNANYLNIGLLLLLIALLSSLLKLNQIGGITYVLANIVNRIELTSGYGYFGLLENVFYTLSVLYLYKYKYESKDVIISNTIFYVSLITSVFFLSLYGGRKSTIFLIIFIFVYKSILEDKINYKQLVIIFSSMILYFLLVLYLRSGALIVGETYSIAFSDDAFNLFTFVANVSYVDIYVYVLYNLQYTDLWFGSVYLDLFYSPLPSSIYIDKPPVDEGRYLRSILDGMSVSPSTPTRMLYGSSLPPETFGNAILNFGYVGIIPFYLILSISYGHVYKKMIKSNFDINYIFIYLYVIFNFEISNLRIFQLFVFIVLTYAIAKSINVLKYKKY